MQPAGSGTSDGQLSGIAEQDSEAWVPPAREAHQYTNDAKPYEKSYGGSGHQPINLRLLVAIFARGGRGLKRLPYFEA
jgi:hypothetical protein